MSDFETGLCECFSDCDTCLCAFCCPCIQFCRNVSNHDSQLPCGSFPPLYCFIYYLAGGYHNLCLSWQNRIHIRYALGYKRRDCCDCMAVLFCHPCSLAQEGRALKRAK